MSGLNRISRRLTQEKAQGASQAMLHAAGLTEADMDKAQVGIVDMAYEGNPCNMHLGLLGEAVKEGVVEAGLVGLRFHTIGVSDGISMGTDGMSFSLQSRDLIADSIETVMGAQWYDANVSIPGCDKNMPGCLIAMGRVNRPSLMVYGGTIKPGCTAFRNEAHPEEETPRDIVSAFQSYGEYLAGTITRPIRRLAAAAEGVRRGHGRQQLIPDFSRRRDEIGELSASLRDMTSALWTRMDAIERFAADVAHEIKNPLTSLRSAVETVSRIKDPEQQRRLMAIILEDVQRLDRLITDISDASRLDAELSRAEAEEVDMASLLKMLVDLYDTTLEDGGPVLRLTLPPFNTLYVTGMEDRLVQVFRNLIGNAISFSPPGGVIAIKGRREGGYVIVEVEDEGPGIPSSKLAAIFDRFYTERPAGEKFGRHRLVAAVHRRRRLSARKVLRQLWKELERFVDGRAFRDDATLVVVRGAVGFGPSDRLADPRLPRSEEVEADRRAGRPLDGRGALRTLDTRPLHGKPINPLNRAPIRQPLDVGVRAINGLLRVGRGQRG